MASWLVIYLITRLLTLINNLFLSAYTCPFILNGLINVSHVDMYYVIPITF